MVKAKALMAERDELRETERKARSVKRRIQTPGQRVEPGTPKARPKRFGI